MAQNVTIANAEYNAVPAIEVPKQGGGTASFFDVTDTTATASDVVQGKYFFSSSGILTEGTAVMGGGSAITVVDTPDPAGGTVRTITAVDLSSDTVDAAHLLNGYTAHDHLGNPVTGTASGGGGSVSYDTKSVTASNYPVSLQFTSMKGEPKFFTVRLNAQVSSSGSTTYYYIVNITSNGTTTHGNCFRIGSTRRVDNITSGYSCSYSGTTLTITSSASSRSASPGAFYNGSYELMYAY